MKRSQRVRGLCSVLALCCLGHIAPAEPSATAVDPQADALLLRHVEALGGAAALRTITAQRITGAIHRNGNKVPHVRTQKGPNLLLVETHFPRPGTLKQGYNGSIGWIQHPLQGGRLLEARELAELARQAWLHPALQLREAYPVRKWLGARTVAGEKLTALALARKNGAAAETWLFDAATDLVSRIEQTVDGGPQGEIQVTIIFEDYREVTGIMMPFVITTILGGGIAPASVLRVESIEHNFPVNETIFQPAF